MARGKPYWDERIVASLVHDPDDETCEVGSPAYFGKGDRTYTLTLIRRAAIWRNRHRGRHSTDRRVAERRA